MTIALLRLPFAQAEDGITSDKIVLGMSTVLSGQSSTRGLESRQGSELYFRKINGKGGINGRKIELLVYDDGYEPKRAYENAIKLIENDKVFALYEFFGSSAAKAVLPLVEKGNVPLVTPLSTAGFLRTPVSRNVFNVRTSALIEANTMIRYLAQVRKISDIGIFYQDDALGTEAKVATLQAFEQFGLKRKCEGSYIRNTVNIDQALERIRAGNPAAVMLWAVSRPAAAFIRKAVSTGFHPLFFVNSSVNEPEFWNEINDVDAEVLSTQNVPYPAAHSAPLVAAYLKEATAAGQATRTAVGFEGYLNAAFTVEALKLAGKNLTRDTFRQAIEAMKNTDLGGVHLSFSPQNHAGLKASDVIKRDKGRLVPLTTRQ